MNGSPGYKYEFEELTDEAVLEFANTILLGLRIYTVLKARSEAVAFINGYIVGLEVKDKQ